MSCNKRLSSSDDAIRGKECSPPDQKKGSHAEHQCRTIAGSHGDIIKMLMPARCTVIKNQEFILKIH